MNLPYCFQVHELERETAFQSPMFPRTGKGQHRKSSSPLTSVGVQDPQNKVGYIHMVPSFFLECINELLASTSLTPLRFSELIHL